MPADEELQSAEVQIETRETREVVGGRDERRGRGGEESRVEKREVQKETEGERAGAQREKRKRRSEDILVLCST